jgi:hypothetical protein
VFRGYGDVQSEPFFSWPIGGLLTSAATLKSPRHDLSPVASAKAHRVWLGWRCVERCGGMLNGEGGKGEEGRQKGKAGQRSRRDRGRRRPSQSCRGKARKGLRATRPGKELVLAQPPPSLANSSHRTAGRCRPLQALFATTPQLAADVQAWRRSTAQRPVAATEKAKTTRGLSRRRCGIRGRPTTSYLVNTDTAKTDDFGHGSRNNQASTADQSPGPPGVRPFAPCRLLHPQSPNADATAQSGSSKHSSQAP